jgi:hypothetical protein
LQLSAIRNLVIPKQNKQPVIEGGLVEIIVPMLSIYQPPVIFKLLGTLRMLIDGQDELSLKLLADRNLIESLVDWAKKTPDMVGVNSEASRLLAWLVKNAYRLRDKPPSNDALQPLINAAGAIDVLVKMLSSTHVVMQNEAIIALTIITISSRDSEIFLKSLIEANLADAIAEFIQRIADTERITNEIIDNLSSLITVLKKSETMRKYLEEKQIDEKAIPRVKELATL